MILLLSPPLHSISLLFSFLLVPFFLHSSLASSFPFSLFPPFFSPSLPSVSLSLFCEAGSLCGQRKMTLNFWPFCSYIWSAEMATMVHWLGSEAPTKPTQLSHVHWAAPMVPFNDNFRQKNIIPVCTAMKEDRKAEQGKGRHQRKKTMVSILETGDASINKNLPVQILNPLVGSWI